MTASRRDGHPSLLYPRPMRRIPLLALLAPALACGSGATTGTPGDAGSDTANVVDAGGTVCRADRWCRVDVGVKPMNTFGSSLEAVSGSSATDVWTVGQDGVILHWDGAVWSQAVSGVTAALGGVYAASPTDAWAVGDAGTIVHWDGSAWSASKSGTNATLFGVWGSSGTDVWAVGATGLILHFDGSAWTPSKSGTTKILNRVHGTSPNDAWAVGESGTILHYDGATWLAKNTFTTMALDTVWATTPTDAWALQSNGAIMHWDGAQWARTVNEPITTTSFNGIAGPAGNDVWAVGWDAKQSVAHFDGAAWSMVAGDPVPLNGSLNAVWTPKGSTEVWAVGTPGLNSRYTIWWRKP